MMITREQLDSLSERELEVLTLFKQGISGVEIAAQLKVSYATIKGFHMVHIYRKLGLFESSKKDSKAGPIKGRQLMRELMLSPLAF